MSLIHNERWKLTATWLNTLASGIVVVGVFTPAIAVAYGFSTSIRETWILAGLTAICAVAGGSLHLLARWMLGRLQP